MSERLLATTAADERGMTRRRVRNLLIAILLPLAIAAGWFAAFTGLEERTSALPALIVNDDEMVEQTNDDGTTTPVVAGRLLVSRLTDPSQPTGFDWGLANREQADAALAAGEAYVVVTIPSDFSASVTSFSNGMPRPARVSVETDQAHDYLAGLGARTLSDAIAAQFGTELTEQVVTGLVGGVERSAEGLEEAANGARQLADGAGGLGSGARQLGDGARAADEGARQLADGAWQLADGSIQLADGTRLLGNGASDLGTGAWRLESGASQLSGGAGALAAGQQQAADGAAAAAAGTGRFVGGVESYTAGAERLATGSRDYAGGVREYVDGVARYTTGVDQLVGPVASLDGVVSQIPVIEGGDADLSAAQIDAAITDAVAAYEAVKAQVQRLEGDPDGSMTAFCGSLADPELSARCLAAIPRAGDIDWQAADAGIAQLVANRDQIAAAGSQLGGVNGVVAQLKQLTSGAVELENAGGQIRQGGAELVAGGDELADGAEEFAGGGALLVDGGRQLESGANALASGQQQLAAGAGQLAGGASDLADGTGQLAQGADQLAAGAGPLAAGADQLADGQRQAAGGADQLADGVGQLGGGADQLGSGADQLADGNRDLANGLQSGADEARASMPSPKTFAEVAAHPVEALATAQHDPGVGGMLTAMFAPLTIWLAGLVTTLRRRLIAPDELASTASTSRVLLRAMARLALPIGAVAAVLLVLAHAVYGVRLEALPGTIAVLALLVAATAAIHALLIAMWGRRGGAIGSIAAFALQLLAIRGLVPLELKSAFVPAIEAITPLPQGANALQGLAANGDPSSWAPQMAAIAVIALLALGAAWIAIARSRRASVPGLASSGELRAAREALRRQGGTSAPRSPFGPPMPAS